jgi:hypothetical protein
MPNPPAPVPRGDGRNSVRQGHSIMLGLFNVKISSFDTVRLLKCFVVNFANLGEISGGPLACGIR